jgi:hypothetical protein
MQDLILDKGLGTSFEADLRYANLSGAELTKAKLVLAKTGTRLISTNLKCAERWTNEQLAQAESLANVTMPDGTKMTKKAEEEIKKHHFDIYQMASMSCGPAASLS